MAIKKKQQAQEIQRHTWRWNRGARREQCQACDGFQGDASASCPAKAISMTAAANTDPLAWIKNREAFDG